MNIFSQDIDTMKKLQLVAILYMNLMIIRISGVCQYGSDPLCLFPCNCQSDHDGCDSKGKCTQGCRDGPPRNQGFEWRGYGCRIGNVAFDKPCSQSGNSTCDKRLTDGNILTDPDHKSCSSISAAPEERVWWNVDLLQQHKLYNITIFNSNDGVMTDVKIFVSSSSNIDVDGISCAHVAEIAESAKVEAACHSPRFGRYVSIQYTNMAPKTVTQSLCEIVSVGHPIPDCSKCASGASCDDFDGCSKCPDGYKRPYCTECPLNRFGPDCGYTCHCKDGAPCESVTGICKNGCADWYVGKDTVTCHIHIADLSWYGGTPRLVSTTFSSATIVYRRMLSVPDPRFYKFIVVVDDIIDFYVYGTERWFDELQHTGNNEVVITADNLLPNTTYNFYVQFWKDINVTTYGNQAAWHISTSSGTQATTNGTYTYIELPFHTDKPLSHEVVDPSSTTLSDDSTMLNEVSLVTPDAHSKLPETASDMMLSSQDSADGDKLGVGALSGIVIGVLAALFLTGALGAVIASKCNKKDDTQEEPYCYINNTSQPDLLLEQVTTRESEFSIANPGESAAAISLPQPQAMASSDLKDRGAQQHGKNADDSTITDGGYLTMPAPTQQADSTTNKGNGESQTGSEI